MSENNYADDFVSTLKPTGRRDLPAMHPREQRERWVNTERTPLTSTADDQQNLFTFPKKRLRARYGMYNLGSRNETLALEEVMNHCLNDGWILAREEWATNAEGERVVSVKYLEPMDAQSNASASPPRPLDGSDLTSL